ncbi:MAG TPA: sugar MFS transporter [Flavobacteriales bacterium]|jgi:FHS family L-fucose permease-like MFS transporter|nr:sugar MFS transporter [Flavobacteriales bacterium]MBK7112834.1 sugar MFS transporter [Flavobacteriales bacterium]MBK7620220.1 sugar MFS transporter [Flavobacteriales bacterium]MBK8530333.1 sugar MFS transporter [Flavobacteriales bacterium]MBK8707237.1 sugar MFS transporter [Flavobacteriales bacterium]
MQHERGSWGPVAVVTSLFFMWGFITVLVDSLIPRLREVFELSYFEAGLVQFAFFIAYGLVSIPAGWLLTRIGYKNGMLVGLATMGVGCLLFWPAAGLRLFPLFMLGYFVLAAGMTVLQVAANPYVAVLGEESRASSRLNLAQAFNSVGTTIAPIIGAQFILSDRIRSSVDIDSLGAAERLAYLSDEAAAVQGPFIVLAGALLVLALIVGLIHLPRILEPHRSGTYAEALRKPGLLGGALGIFLYVGAEVAIGSYLVNYFLSMGLDDVIRHDTKLAGIAGTLLGKDLGGVDAKGVVGAFVALYWGGAMIGRFAGSYLTRVFKPELVLTVFGLSAITLVLISMRSTGTVAMWSMLSVGLFNSIMFPTIFTQSIAGLGQLKPQGSGILCTAICGGAIIPPLLGALADVVGFKVGFLLVVGCYAYIAFFAWKLNRRLT